MLFAKVKKDARWSTVRACGGEIFVKSEFRPVPAECEDEARKHSALVITDRIPEEQISNDVPDTVGYKASKTAQDLADEHGIDLAQVIGTGKDGSIKVGDVRKLLSQDE